MGEVLKDYLKEGKTLDLLLFKLESNFKALLPIKDNGSYVKGGVAFLDFPYSYKKENVIEILHKVRSRMAISKKGDAWLNYQRTTEGIFGISDCIIVFDSNSDGKSIVTINAGHNLDTAKVLGYSIVSRRSGLQIDSRRPIKIERKYEVFFHKGDGDVVWDAPCGGVICMGEGDVHAKLPPNIGLQIIYPGMSLEYSLNKEPIKVPNTEPESLLYVIKGAGGVEVNFK